MRKMIPTLFSLSIIVFCACPKLDQGTTVDSTEDALLGCWTNAYEEETAASSKIYRPCDYTDFPASRFRDAMEFMEEGECRYLALSPHDAHHMVEGRWEYLEATKEVKISSIDGSAIKTLRILEVGDDILRLTDG